MTGGPFDGKAVLTGAGKSQVGRRLGRTGLAPTLEAVLRAITDAGLSVEDVDGIASYPGPGVPPEAAVPLAWRAKFEAALATVSLGKAALRSAATMLGSDLAADGVRVATLTIAGQIVAGTPFDPERIAERYWEVVNTDGPWQSEFRFTGE